MKKTTWEQKELPIAREPAIVIEFDGDSQAGSEKRGRLQVSSDRRTRSGDRGHPL